jgi:polyisoprenoid-binding protein YceI
MGKQVRFYGHDSPGNHMTFASGTHSIEPENGTLTVKVYKEGMAAKMGHDLTFEASDWSGKITVDTDDPSASSVQVTIDPSSLEIVNAEGGAKPLSDKDRADIAKNITKTLGNSDISFESTEVSGTAPRISLKGNLTISGTARPVTLDLTVGDDGHAAGRTTIVQSQYGIKPYSAMMGALKVKDSVDVEFDVTLPTS